MEKKPYINVDELMPQVSLELAANFYGVTLPELRRVGNETRTACFLNCGKYKATGHCHSCRKPAVLESEAKLRD